MPDLGNGMIWPNYPSEPPGDYWDDVMTQYYADIEDQDERLERGEYDEVVAEDDERDWGAWLESGERPVANTG